MRGGSCEEEAVVTYQQLGCTAEEGVGGSYGAGWRGVGGLAWKGVAGKAPTAPTPLTYCIISTSPSSDQPLEEKEEKTELS